jgi:hypothetical protein
MSIVLMAAYISFWERTFMLWCPSFTPTFTFTGNVRILG